MPTVRLDPRGILFVATAVAVATLSCGREPTGPGRSGGVVRSQGIAFVTEFPPALPAFQAAGGSGVAFDRVRIVLNNPDGTIALDTVVTFPAGATELQLTLSVPLPASAPSTGLPLALNLRYVNAAGDTVFRGGPVTVTAVPRTPGAGPPPPVPVTIPITYTGPGANAVAVRISPRTLTVNTGGAFTFSAQALDAGGAVLANTPVVFTVSDPSKATINAATGAGTAGSARGTTTVTAQLLTGPTDGATLTIVSPPASIAAESGGGQAGPVNAQLAQPVVVAVTATDGLPAAGVTVAFAAQNGGSVGSASATTGPDGRASTTWRLGATPGAQTLTASATGLSGSPVTFSATARPVDPVRLEVLTPPPASVAAGAAFGLAVRAVDGTGALTPAFTGAVTVATGAGAPPGALLTGTTTVNAVAGVATFTDLKLNLPGTYTLGASTPSLAGATTGSFTVTAGAAAKLVFQNYPIVGAQAGARFDAVSVVAKDSIGNTVATFTGPVTLTAVAPAAAAVASDSGAAASAAAVAAAGASSVGPAAGAPAHALTGVTTVNAVAGVAVFPGLAQTTAGSWALAAAAPGLTGVTGPAFTITPGAASALSLVSGGGQSAAGGAALPNPVVVKVSDAYGNGVGGVTVAFAPTATSGSTSPASTPSAAGTGLAQTAWTLGGVAGPMTLNVSGPGLSPNPLAVSATATTTTAAGPAAALSFTTQPSNVAASTSITPAVVVAAKDAGGILATSFTGTVTLAIGANPAAGTLAGTLSVAAVGGIATFSNLSINNVGAGYTLTASSGALTAATSNAFNVTGGAIATTKLNPNVDSLFSLTDTVRKVATSRDAFANVVPGTYVWVSRNPAVATVTATGLVTAIANGATYVVVAETGGTKDSTLVVVQQRLATIRVTPGTRSIYRAGTYAFAAAAVDGRNQPILPAPAFTWSTVAPSVATVTASGVVTAVALGATQVRAAAGAIIGVANVTVLTPITRIVVGRDSAGVPVTDTTSLAALGFGRAFVAQARDTLDAPMTGVTFTWATTNPTVALLDSTFATRAHALSNANGITSIQASADGVVGAASLRVQQLLASVSLSAVTTTIAPLGTVQLVPAPLDANGRAVATPLAYTYASAAPGVATVSATGLVTGVAVGTANMTAVSGAVTSAPLAITVANTGVPAIISFGRDTLAVGRGSSTSIPILLSKPNATPVTVNLSARDTNAYFAVASVTIPANQASANVTLNGRNAGTTLIYATDGSGTGYAGATSVVKVQANVRFASTSWSINAGDQIATQVLLSDPSPAGGTYITYGYGTPGRASVSPDPAFIPAGQLASNVVITGLGTTTGSTTITPLATGVNGTASTLNVSAPVLTISAGAAARLGSGQFESGWYVYTPQYTNVPVPLAYTSTDTNIVRVSPVTGAIPAGSYYQYFTVSGLAPGTANVIVSATGWKPDTLTMTITSPRLGVCCSATLQTTSPTQSLTIYAEDSLASQHYRTSSLALAVSSSDTTVIKVIDKTPSIAAGQRSVSGVRYQPGGAGGTAYLKVTAGGHAPDSVLVTVVGPKLEFSWCCTNQLAKGTYDSPYIYAPNSVASPLTVTLTSANPAKVGVPTTVTIPAGTYYVYFNVTGTDTTTSSSIIASAPGYQGDTAYYRVTSPRLSAYGGTTLNNLGPGTYFGVQVYDSLGGCCHRLSSPLTVTLRSTDTTKIKVDSATVTIPAGLYANSSAHVSVVGIGTAYIVATAPGHTPDSTLYTVQTPKLNFSIYSTTLGKRQTSGTNAFYVYTPDSRTAAQGALAVTFTQKQPVAVKLSTTAPTVPVGTYYAYFDASGLATGVDTVIATAAGYLPDTAFIAVSATKFTGGGIPSTANTTNANYTATVYAADVNGTAHPTMDTVVVHVLSSDTTVIRPTQPYVRILPGQYYVQPTYAYRGPGTATLTYSDSAGVYAPLTSNAVTVTGPSLVFSASSVMYGMRQQGSGTDYYVYTQNNVAAPLTVNLLSTDTRVATVPATITIPAGTYYAYFNVQARDTVGTIQIQASATGYGSPTPMTVQVTPPKFVISTSTSARTTQGPQAITIYAADATGGLHYTSEAVKVGLTTSSAPVFTVDSTFVTIPAGAYYNNTARWLPGANGGTSAQLAAYDCTGVASGCPPTTRPALYAYTTTTANLSVTTPSLGFSWGSVNLGLGQYIDQAHLCCFYVQTQDNLPLATPVALGHAGVAKTSVPATTTIAANSYYSYFKITATGLGTDTLTAALAAPLHNGATAYVVVDSGRVTLPAWTPAVVGDSVLVTLQTRDPAAANLLPVAAATSFNLTALGGKVQFRVGGVAVTSVTVPADGNQVQFYVKSLASGADTITIAGANYKTFTSPVTIP